MPTRGLRWRVPYSRASPLPRDCWRSGRERATPSPVKYVLLVHLAATLVMVGVIWFVQIVHYPPFSRVGSGGSPSTPTLTPASRPTSSDRRCDRGGDRPAPRLPPPRGHSAGCC